MVRVTGFRIVIGAIAGMAALGVISADMAQAKVGAGSSMGSRGARTYSAPPATSTAPKAAAPMDRTMTQPGAQARSPAAATAAAATAARPSMFGSMGGMFRGLLLGGLMAGVLGSIFGFGAMANMLGFVLQAALIGGLLFLAYSFFRNRLGGTPALATARSPQGDAPRPQDAYLRTASAAGGGAATPALTLQPDDFSAFERLLSEIQLAYGRGDQKTIGDHVTPEMLSYFAGDLAENARKGVRNEISAPKLLQGDLSEAWREERDEYATVAMRFSLLDRMVDIASGRVISGSATNPQESTEIWTFSRPRGGKPDQWELSGIQQA